MADEFKKMDVADEKKVKREGKSEPVNDSLNVENNVEKLVDAKKLKAIKKALTKDEETPAVV